MIAATDFMRVQPISEDSLLLSYTNDSDFAGVSFASNPVFHIRFKAKFYEERYPEEIESDADGEGAIVKFSASIKTQKRLVVDPLPPFMHKTIKLALACNTLFIANESYIQEDPYEIEMIDERYPFFQANVFLTLTKSSTRN